MQPELTHLTILSPAKKITDQKIIGPPQRLINKPAIGLENGCPLSI